MSTPSNTPRYIKVAVPSPLRSLFDYVVPDSLKTRTLIPGQRAKVPFGARTMVGLITEVCNKTNIPSNKLKPVIEILDETPALDAELLALYLWSSDYYHYPVGQALQTSLPVMVKNGKALHPVIDPVWILSEKGKELDPVDLKKAPRQQQVLALLKKQSPLATQQINELLDGKFYPAVKALLDKELITNGQAKEVFHHTEEPLTLNDSQQSVINALKKNIDSFKCHLLEGITGSGKTEIYLQLIAKVLSQGKQVLILVPEIGLTPQTVSRFKSRFQEPVTLIHSGLTDTQRFNAWLEARSGKTRIIIGTRSAVFIPQNNLGLIVIDEEHDGSFKQQEGFRYSARDLGIYRAKQLDIPVLLGSATPSFESLSKALSGRYIHHVLEQRAGEAKPPSFRFIDLCGEQLSEGFAPTLLEQIRYQLKQGQQVLVFINRRGFAPILQCHDCGWVVECPRCEMSYTLHQRPPSLHCHHCEGQTSIPKSCEQCSSKKLLPIGYGTERSETFLKSFFPDFPVIRVDRDSTRAKDSLQDILNTVNSGEPCILIGTQMLAKGHHFPNVTLVAILDADSGLFSANFRGQEFLGQLITQVAGRSGRGAQAGEVFIQTHHIDHPTLQTLVAEGYSSLARQLLTEREQFSLPPYSFQALVKAEANQHDLPLQLLNDASEFCEKLFNDASMVLGPIPSPMEKRAGKFRFQLLLQTSNRKLLHDCVAQLLPFLESHSLGRKVRSAIDIDPLDFT